MGCSSALLAVGERVVVVASGEAGAEAGAFRAGWLEALPAALALGRADCAPADGTDAAWPLAEAWGAPWAAAAA